MTRDWETVFQAWTKPSGDTECEKQDNAERMIRAAIDEYEPLAKRDIKVISQGSYRNNTNVRQESDVDICVCCMNAFYADYAFADYGAAEAGNANSDYTYGQLKSDVESALVKKFGRNGVTRGNKAFDVHPNTYRVDADVVAAFAHRRYQKKFSNFGIGGYVFTYTEPEGTQFFADSGGAAIINWPEQHYANGVAKNKATGYRFKYVTRALKNLKYEMEVKGNAAQQQAAKEAPSYLIECLMYNVAAFGDGSCYRMVREAIVYAHNATKTDDACKEWVEVNGLKYLLRGGQPWTRTQASAFLLHAWQYGEFS